jgi:predicted RNase H-like nuclease
LSAVLGVDGWKGAWVAALVTTGPRPGPVGWRFGRFADLLTDDLAVVAVDIPVGLSETGRRACDLAGRAALGRAASRLFPMPSRHAFGTKVASHVEANAALRARGEPGISAQTWALRAAVGEVGSVAATDPRIVEVHPELSFLALSGSVLASKKTIGGLRQRLAALAPWLDPWEALQTAPSAVPVDDCLDALAAAWSAARVASGAALTYPATDAPLAPSGRPMAIYA